MAVAGFLVLAVAFAALAQSALSAQYVVGESAGWVVPSANGNVNYSAWALKNNYHPGDALLFNYPDQGDSVLEVNRNDFTNCIKTNPINHHSDGKTLIRLSRPGPHWFISGVPGHCEQGQKFGIMVTPASPGSRATPSVPSAPTPTPSTVRGSPGPSHSHPHSPAGSPKSSISGTAAGLHAPAPAPMSAAANVAPTTSGIIAIAIGSLFLLSWIMLPV